MGLFSSLWDAVRDFFTGASDGGPSGPIHRLYVGNLSYKVKEEELRALFARHGRVKTLHLIRDRLTRRLKGYAFIEMSPEDARKALDLNGHDFLGRKLVVSVAKSKQQRPPRRGHPASPSGAPAPQKESGPEHGRPQGPSHGQGQGQGRGQGRWRNKRRNGPKAYGADGQQSDTPIQRYE